jgi:mono/diheme cytochrome c family protein
MKCVLTMILVVAVLGAGALLYVWSGSYNIAATEPHWTVTSALIEMLRDRSVAARSDGIKAPDLNEPQLKEAAFSHYHQMCRLCHGAPAYPPEEFARGFYPAPPSMMSGHIQAELGEAELYWIVKHGLKMTGMPAFGPTHDEKELWGLVALAKEMPQTSPAQYRQRVEAEQASEHEHTH